MTDKLRECPFCGGQANIIEEPILGAYQVYCTECPVNVGRYWFFEEEDAIKAWNKRSYIDEIVEQLEEASCYIEDGDGHAGHVVFTDKAIAVVKGVQNE